MNSARKNLTKLSDARPFLRWAGSKRQLLPELRQLWVDGRRYVEPFAGSACLFFDVAPRTALLADINRELIETYLEVKYNVSQLVQELNVFTNTREDYLRVRSIDAHSLDRSARAARFIYLNRFCFNGLYRINKSGKFNVPYGGAKSGVLPLETELKCASKLLKNAKLRSWDFEKTLSMVRDGDFVYMDPPFRIRGSRAFHQYDSSDFGTSQLEVLRKWMERLADVKIPFLVSYAESAEADFLKRGFNFRNVLVRRNIAGFTDRRGHVTEVLISSHKIPV